MQAAPSESGPRGHRPRWPCTTGHPSPPRPGVDELFTRNPEHLSNTMEVLAGLETPFSWTRGNRMCAGPLLTSNFSLCNGKSKGSYSFQTNSYVVYPQREYVRGAGFQKPRPLKPDRSSSNAGSRHTSYLFIFMHPPPPPPWTSPYIAALLVPPSSTPDDDLLRHYLLSSTTC